MNPSLTLLEDDPRVAARSHAPWRHWSWGTVVIPVATLTVVTVKYGIGLHPNWFRFSGAVDTWPDMASSLLAVGDRALLSNAAPAWIAGALQLPAGDAYTAFSLGLTLLALALPFAMRRANATFLHRYGVVLAGGALAPVLLMWVGGYDALLVVGLTVGALARRGSLITAGWLVAAATHAAVAIPAAAVWLAVLLLGRSTSRDWLRSTAVATALGLALGYIVIHTATDAWGGSTDRLALFQAIPYHLIWEAYVGALPAILLSSLGIGWVLVLWPSALRLRVTRAFLACALSAALAVPLIAVDETRVTALILVPATLAWVDAWSTQAPLPVRTPGWLLAVAVAIPIPVVWMGVSYWPYWL